MSSIITILHIFYFFGDHTTKKKFVTRDATKFSPILLWSHLALIIMVWPVLLKKVTYAGRKSMKIWQISFGIVFPHLFRSWYEVVGSWGVARHFHYTHKSAFAGLCGKPRTMPEGLYMPLYPITKGRSSQIHISKCVVCTWFV